MRKLVYTARQSAARCGTVKGMDKQEHAAALRTAMARKQMSNKKLANVLGVHEKTIGNWRSGETLPSLADRMRLEKLFPGYANATQADPVEAALMASPLAEHRRLRVLAAYRSELYEQQREASA